jgi:hypothetical protein
MNNEIAFSGNGASGITTEVTNREGASTKLKALKTRLLFSSIRI